MKTAQKKTVLATCAEWHGGQWSALYQFCSTGVYVPKNAALYVAEILDCLNWELAPYPNPLSKKETDRLTSCLNYFINQAAKVGIIVEVGKHSYYGYNIAVIANPGKYDVIAPQYPN